MAALMGSFEQARRIAGVIITEVFTFQERKAYSWPMVSIEKILIAGGGSSGWMTAALLSKSLPKVKITLIESSDIPIIGVGESTNQLMVQFNRAAGFDDELSMMRASNGAYKFAIRFKNFNHKGGVFFHPFIRQSENRLSLAAAGTIFNNLRSAPDSSRGSSSYAYQIDAGLYGQFLKLECKRRGVRQVVDSIRKVNLLPNGHISSVDTERHGTITADLFIDCTGFRSLLLDQNLREPFISSSRFLLNDRAIATRVPYCDKNRELKPYTDCTALSAGWAWEIPLWSRVGKGYVYSSAFLDREKAEAEFRRFVGAKRLAGLEFNHIDIRVGRRERAWAGNCVGIGLSYGFLEPLESTGISLTQAAIMDLSLALTSNISMSVNRALFNRRCGEMFDFTRDFIVAHYALTSREDTPYWKFICNENPLPDSLLELLSQARRLGRAVVNHPNRFYGPLSWNAVLFGMGLFGKKTPLSERTLRLPTAKQHVQFLKQMVYDEAVINPLDNGKQAPAWSWASESR